MAIKEGQFVRHTAKSEWGVGKIEEVSGDNVSIQFSDAVRTIKMPFAEKFLEAATASEFTAAAKPRVGRAIGPSAKCGACQKALNRSRRSADNAWKSCPKCSVRDGVEHVYYQYPDAFGETEARASDEDPAGAQSYCVSCRADRPPTGPARSCSKIGPTK